MHLRWVSTLLLSLLACGSVVAETPRTCLVLSGGGARGMAHVGVLRVLERERIPVDCVVGTSMGAVVGSLYASGMSAGEIEKAVRDMDWKSMFDDAGDRRLYPIRRKQEDRAILSKAALGFRDGRVAVAPGLFLGQRLGLMLRGMLLPVAGTDDFDELPIVFRAVATDIETGRKVVMDEGDLVTAVRASMAVPGAFLPVDRDNLLLVDGGVSDNLPIDVAQDELGATRIIAVDISSPLLPREKLTNPLAISDQMVTALMRRETELQRARLHSGDVLMTPDMGTLSAADFDGAVDPGIAAGIQAAEAAVPQLRALAVDESRYAVWTDQRRSRIRALGPLSAVNINNRSRMAKQAVLAYLSEHPGQPFDRAAMEADIAKLYGTGEFSAIDYRITADEQSDSVLTVRTRGRYWERGGALRAGLKLEDNFNGESNFQLSARLTRGEINQFGGEWLVEAGLGKITHLGGEWHQPLDMQRRWFVRPRVEFIGRNQPIFSEQDGELIELLEFRRESLGGSIALGANFGTWGELTLAPFVRRSKYSLRAGVAPPNAPGYLTTAGLEARLYIDTLDHPDFPADGWLFDARHTRYLDSFGSDIDSHGESFSAIRAFSPGEGRLVASLRARYAKDLQAPEEIAFLGGFLNLSGFPEDSLAGRMSAFGSLSYHYPLASLGKYPLFVGGSLEAGNAWPDPPSITPESLMIAGSVFGAAATPMGPVYLGYGQAEGGHRALYFFIGRPY